jgi:hypothetical protein
LWAAPIAMTMNRSLLSRPHTAPAALLTAVLAALLLFGTTRGSAHPPRTLISIATVTPAATQTISGNVTWQISTSGVTDHVDFYVDGKNSWTERFAPYIFNGDPDGRLDTTLLSNGQHELQAVGYDAKGRAASTTIDVTVSNGSAPPPPPAPSGSTIPQVSISQPTNAQTVSGDVPWIARASGATVAKITFSVDGQLKWTEFTSPYYFDGDPDGALQTTTLSNGAHTLTSSAYGTDGRSSTASVSVNVSNGIAPAPTTVSAPANTGSPTISGTPQVGIALTATTGTWTGSAPIAYADQWQRCTSGYCGAITGATATTYVPTSADVGATLRVVVTATNSAGSSTASSGNTALVAASNSTTPATGAPAWPDTSEPSYTPTRVATTVGEFNTILGSLRGGDVVEVKPMTIGGEVMFTAKPSTSVAIHFDSGVRFTGAPAGSSLPAVWIRGSNLQLYGGEISNLGNDCVRVQAASADTSGVTNFRWWGAKIHDCAGTGFAVHGTSYPNSGLDIAAEIWRCGLNLSLDPHAEKGTGLHGAYLGGGTTGSSGRFMLDVHDQPAGAAVSIGANLQNSQLWVRAHRITFQAISQVAGNAVQLWGANNANVTVKDIEADTLAGRVVETDALDGGSGLTVQYARGTNVRLAPYALGSYVTCVSCS